MRNDGIDPAETAIEFFAEMRYVGQSHQLEIKIGDNLDEQSVPDAVQAFHDTHLATYNHSDPEAATEFVMLRLVRRRNPDESNLLESHSASTGANITTGKREICIDSSRGYEPVPVYQRAELPVGFEFTGPAIVEQSDTTTLVYRDHRASVDSFGNLIIDVPQASY